MAEMFDRVAPRYDKLNRILSTGRDVGWRRRAAALARMGPREIALDVGVGTGDLAFGLLYASDPSVRVVGVDLSPMMIDSVRRRAAARLDPRLAPLLASAAALPIPDASFDRVVAGMTLRHLCHLSLVLPQLHRLLRACGRAS